jgi:hypothetical protein
METTMCSAMRTPVLVVMSGQHRIRYQPGKAFMRSLRRHTEVNSNQLAPQKIGKLLLDCSPRAASTKLVLLIRIATEHQKEMNLI